MKKCRIEEVKNWTKGPRRLRDIEVRIKGTRTQVDEGYGERRKRKPGDNRIRRRADKELTEQVKMRTTRRRG